MGWLGSMRIAANALLRPLGMRVESLAAEWAEAARLDALAGAGHFDRPAFRLPTAIARCDPAPVLEAVRRYEGELARFDAAAGAGGYSFRNDYFASPDAEVLYAMIRMLRPRRIVEVGSGNSTILARHAIADGGLQTRLTAIDPDPRREVADVADEILKLRVESDGVAETLSGLGAGDVLFIDSSHEIKPGNDVLFLLLNVLPGLGEGAVVHVHDIFLSYDYPRQWVVDNRWRWTEQYLVQALLQDTAGFDVLWAGHHFQRSLPGFSQAFRYWRGEDAKSLWLRRCVPAPRPGGAP